MAEVNSANSVTGTDSYGNKYTQSVSNDSLTTNDFLKLMIEEFKLQDPTKPMDSSKILSTQMQMSTLNANMEMIKALQSIQTAFNQSSLSTATGVIGRIVENGSTNSDGESKKYIINSIEVKDGEAIVVAYETLYTKYGIMVKDGDTDDVLSLGDLNAKLRAFGWEVLEEKNGNDLEAVIAVLEHAKSKTGNGKPVAIILHTEMGQGVDFMMGSHAWHGKAPNDAQLESALSQLYVETEADY
jgi:flagellar hook assembly protein FlgD